MNLKKILKTIKLNESTISMILGAIVILIVGSLVVRYIRSDKGTLPENNDDINNVEMAGKTHKVAKGDNLWNIAITYYGDGFKWVDIATENKLENASELTEGQELIIPDLREVVSDSEVTTDKQTTEDSISAATYEVVKGDNLWNIAVRAYGDGYKWVQIAKENNLINPNVIHSGNVLVLPR